MSRKKTANAWMRRHLRDPYVKQAVRVGYRSRAAFKLIELDERDRLLRPGMAVVDLGAAPGGWSQVAVERVTGSGRVVAIDVLAMDPIPGVTFVREDVHAPRLQAAVSEALSGQLADLVLSDMAPNLTGVRSVDETRSQELVVASVGCARRMLKPGGCLLVKVFHGSGLDAVMREMREVFQTVTVRKPPASRSRSSEVYVLCRGLK
jgi:23S rRNA (uridine2552-2'-O)-methyltransferase